MMKLNVRMQSWGCLKALGVMILGIPTLLIVFSVFTGCQQKQQRSPQLQALTSKFDEIKEEMTEEEVDSVFEGYKSSRSDEFRPTNPNDGTDFKRPSTFSKMFTNGPTTEGNFFVRIYFDSAGYVVGKRIGEFVS